MTAITARKKFNQITSSISSFLYSPYYSLSVAIWAVLCFMLNVQTLGLVVLIALTCYILIFVGDFIPLIPPLACFILAVRNFPVLTTLPYIIFYCVLFICFVVHFIRFPVKNLYLGKLFFPLCLVSAALFLGGALSTTYISNYSNTFMLAFAFGPLILIMYLLFLNGINSPENFDIKTFICYNIVLATVFAYFEVLFINYNQGEFFFHTIRSVFWGNFNTIGAMTLLAIPACFYLMTKTGKISSMFFIIVFMLAMNILCRSDGSVGIAIVSLPFLIVLTYLKLREKDKKQYMICVFIFALAVCSLFIFLLSKFGLEEIIAFIEETKKENGRLILYDNALDLFKRNPILGVGVGFFDESVYIPHDGAFNFHSTVFHIMGTMGTFGIIAYSVYYFFRFKVLLSKNYKFNVFIFVSFVLFEAYGLIDVCEFNIVPLMTYVTLLFVCVEKENYKGEDNYLPLSVL